jgi:phosphoenolpyruvate-protein phosphotransferase/dihydroxyacetone kinase phosphotransfer subunit
MVGMVIVSHSRALADSLRELVQQVTNADIPLVVAAGIGPDRSEFGTDATEIMDAIQSVYSPEGVVVLMDLGSAVLSAQMALDLLPPEVAAVVQFCGAPIVEGSISAAVQIGLGSDVQTVCREAMHALEPKRQQLGLPEESQSTLPAAAPVVSTPAEVQQVILTLKNQHGLHARPAARFVQMAALYDANITVRNESSGKGPVQAKSLNALATLGAVGGNKIAVIASGREAAQAVQALSKLVEDAFGESPEGAGLPIEVPLPAAETGAGHAFLQAVPISEGIAIGPLAHLRTVRPAISKEPTHDAEASWAHLQQALRKVQQAVKEQRDLVARSLGKSNAEIFDAHLLILQDPDLLGQARQLIFDRQCNEAAAWDQAITAVKKSFQDLDDTYLRQRAADVTGLGDQVLNALAGKPEVEMLSLEKPAILFAAELTPTQTAALDRQMILGLITVAGGPTSHSAILARALGIPAVTGASQSIEEIPVDTTVAIDGFNGRIWTSLPAEKLAELQAQRQAWQTHLQVLQKTSQELAVTRDGHRVEVVANVGNLQDAEAAVANGAEGIGLLRTEFLFLTRSTPPDEVEQYQALSAIAQRMHNLPVIVRTLDAGGDKDLPYLDMPAEANPFLGVRAIRLCFREPELFKIQLKAILRAGVKGNFRIMFPMIASSEEVLQARQFVDEVHQELLQGEIEHQWPIQTGIMVEIPSAALLSDALAEHVDFFSIGTNDLTQYTLAAERGNPALAHLSDALHPAVLALIKKVVEAAHSHGKWVGVCGELAGDPQATPILVGLGVDELSLNSAGIPRIKAIVRDLDFSEAQHFAEKVLSTHNASEARRLAKHLKVP